METDNFLSLTLFGNELSFTCICDRDDERDNLSSHNEAGSKVEADVAMSPPLSLFCR